jgi:hypothetical protein
MYHKAGQYEECLKRAELTLALCPYHYGALAGLGMSLEKKGIYVYMYVHYYMHIFT